MGVFVELFTIPCLLYQICKAEVVPNAAILRACRETKGLLSSQPGSSFPDLSGLKKTFMAAGLNFPTLWEPLPSGILPHGQLASSTWQGCRSSARCSQAVPVAPP